MLNRIIYWSINHKLIVSLLTLILVILGISELLKLPIDAVPDITNNQVQIITVAPSSGAEDIERIVTFPLEQALASIPGITELRSFSRFGLSVVTVVFTEDTDIYWARQQVAEQLNEVKDEVPSEVGVPTMAPLTSGLGEIYQYTLAVKQGYEHKFSPTDLRSIQDWLVRRQLLGVSGVADVSGFGGNLKTYEISLNPMALSSYGLTISDVFNAVEANNQNTGGAYIEREGMTTFIRSEGLLHSLDEIRQISVGHNRQGLPITVQQIGTVHLGKAVRYGALTYNQQGESVGGIVMMLKGANSDNTITAVKEKVAEIQGMLPKGIEISPYLDRSDLVGRAIDTVTSNLMEGALIVIFVLVIFLGNFRAGIVVASVIPLAMLFAIILMNLTGVSGNLMSLGALDFGLIVDGAVIIVEATMHLLALHKIHRIGQDTLNDTVYRAASKFSSSAVFGQLIILVVYLPILTLVGIEGKMFKPMALTVMFAILGALILSLTYVPMVSSLLLSKRIVQRETMSDRMMESIQRRYQKLFLWMFRKQRWVFMSIGLLFTVSIGLFNQLGAEFIPNLDEGDFAVEMRLLTGASLTNTVEKTEKAAKLLMHRFPEVKKVVGKIGTAEVPTDPMPMEACDLMIILNEKEQWKTTDSKEELANLMKNALESELPGVEFGFQQPIQMRFNELMTGAKQDVVVKVYGEDFMNLSKYATQIGKVAANIQGVEDLYIEQLEGMPQMMIRYNREALSRYGVSVDEVNKAVNASFAGANAGFVYEGEKRFSLVVRLDSNYRAKAHDLKDIYIESKSKTMIPISELADISFETGLNQIQRDDAKRRVLVGFNVRGRDVKSVVNDLNQQVNESIDFQTGYHYTVGGSFKNLEEASNRLLIAVPAALLLIFFLLYLTFNSLVQAMLIFTAIPLASVGGIWALYLRDMPFSISAGIGFIALFGVAVLNGIVLISEYNTLINTGFTNPTRTVMKGTLTRLRPVLLTATVASLGFLPMAISHGSGAEVQKPLATVVIGGLLSATFLTLFVLPMLFHWMSIKKNLRGDGKRMMALILLTISLPYVAQTGNREFLINRALSMNQGLKADSLKIHQAALEASMLVQPEKLRVSAMIGQYNSDYKADNNVTIQQQIPFPTAFYRAKVFGESLTKERNLMYRQQQHLVTQRVENAIEQWLYCSQKNDLLLHEDSLLREISKGIELRSKSGESSTLDNWLLTSEILLIEQAIAEQQRQLEEAKTNLCSLVFLSREALDTFQLTYDIQRFKTRISTIDVPSQTHWLVLDQSLKTMKEEQKTQRALSLPDIEFGYFNQTLVGNVPMNGGLTPFTAANRFQGGNLGLSIPVFSRSIAQRNQWLTLEQLRTQYELDAWSHGFLLQYSSLQKEYDRYVAMYESVKNRGEQIIEGITKVTDVQYNQGEIDQVNWLTLKRNALKIKSNEIDLVHQINTLFLSIKYLGEK